MAKKKKKKKKYDAQEENDKDDGIFIESEEFFDANPLIKYGYEQDADDI